MPTLLIRPLAATDAALYQALRLQALATEPAAFGASFEEEQHHTVDAVAKRMAGQPDAFVLGAFEGDTLVGLVGFGREGMLKLRHKGFIWGMFVAPSHRGHGLGAALLQEALGRARANPGLRRVNLYVNAQNLQAIRLYERCGFVVYGREPQAMLINGVFHEELLMTWLNLKADE
jgi:RimJ/RimL family protein N-acetyltransferase